MQQLPSLIAPLQQQQVNNLLVYLTNQLGIQQLANLVRG
jgi:hypothetical protein